ncbi:autophagy-related protein 16 domain protein [Rhodotorula toruloides]|uniref:Autophagy-related protein 16 domain protein n=1 Tax=Rhodotorula toruloides TaxID=5286 RepID=A0A511KJT0_RHOTO|nr:autophagy-related protein 16 domain protein [Rhodotorula toruloides]
MALAWQDEIRLALLHRDHREHALAPVIAHYSRLAQQTLALKERNSALVHAVRTGGTGGGSAGQGKDTDTAVHSALITSLESQLAQTRADLSEQYKVQSLNAQRLLSLTDSLREAEERGRDERDELARLKMEVGALREKDGWYKDMVKEKERQLVILQDELASLELELSQLELQNSNLKTDNAALLQRWLESKAEEANRMNEANAFLEEAKKLKKEAEEIGGKKGEGKGKERELEAI